MATGEQNKWSWRLRVMGVAMAFVGGLVFALLGVILPAPPTWPAWVVAGALIVDAVLWGFVAALPLRSWWAALIVPVTFFAGVYLGQAVSATETFMLDVLILAILPSAAGAVIGAFTSKRIERSRPQLFAPS